MLTIELSAEITQNYCGVSVLGVSHCNILIDENRDIKIIRNHLVLVAYDYLLTFGSETTFFWKLRRLNGAMILFLLNRYISPTQFAIQLLSEWAQPCERHMGRAHVVNHPTALDLPAFSGEHCKSLYRLPYASALYSTAGEFHQFFMEIDPKLTLNRLYGW